MSLQPTPTILKKEHITFNNVATSVVLKHRLDRRLNIWYVVRHNERTNGSIGLKGTNSSSWYARQVTAQFTLPPGGQAVSEAAFNISSRE